MSAGDPARLCVAVTTGGDKVRSTIDSSTLFAVSDQKHATVGRQRHYRWGIHDQIDPLDQDSTRGVNNIDGIRPAVGHVHHPARRFEYRVDVLVGHRFGFFVRERTCERCLLAIGI